MADEPQDVIEFAIRSAFVAYPQEDDPDWRSPNWIMPKECVHLATAIILELDAKGFQIVKKATLS
jgi:CheY-like chemotaxis protein